MFTMDAEAPIDSIQKLSQAKAQQPPTTSLKPMKK